MDTSWGIFQKTATRGRGGKKVHEESSQSVSLWPVYSKLVWGAAPREGKLVTRSFLFLLRGWSLNVELLMLLLLLVLGSLDCSDRRWRVGESGLR